MLDELDKKILAILDWEARLPATQIARRVRSNKDVVASRIKKLEARGVIKQYYAVLNLMKLGYHSHGINFDTVELTPEREAAFVAFLDKEIRAGLIYRMDAPFKYGIIVWTKDMYSLEGILLRIKRFLGTQLVLYRYRVFCDVTQYPRDAVFGKTHHSRKCSIDDRAPVGHDDEDLAILRELAADSRVSTMELSRRTGIPQQTVSYRMKALERKGVILGYRAEFVIQELRFEHYCIEVYLADQSDVASIEAWADVDPHVTWFETAFGGMDLDLVIEVRDRAALEEKLNELRRRFPNIRKFIYYTERYWKLTYLP
jgi:Lrp/AsnC family leucine-responsive transcriptional regulator